MKNGKFITNRAEIVKFYILFAFTVFMVYFSPPIFNKLYFLILLAFFWRSKKNYFWFAFVFLIITQPGLLFHADLATAVHRVPMYTIVSGTSFHFYDLFFILAFFKAIIKREKATRLLKQPLMLILFYGILLLVMSFGYGMTVSNIIFTFRTLTTFTLFVSIPNLVHKKEEVFQFAHLIFPIIFFVLFNQIINILTHIKIHNILSGSRATVYGLGQDISEYQRADISAILEYFIIVFALVFVSKKDYTARKMYLNFVILFSIIAIIFSGTRTWIGVILVVFILYSFFVAKETSRFIRQIAFIVLIFLLLYSFFPIIKFQVDMGLLRFSTVGQLAKGDITAGGTLGRIDKRLPRVLEGFSQNPSLGWGFSNTFYKYKDIHIGNFNLLLQCGIFGFLIFVYFFLKIYGMIKSTINRLSSHNFFKQPLKVILIGFMGMLILHFTTYQLFGYTGMSQDKIFFSILFICFSEIMVKEARKEELEYQILNYT